MLFNTTISGGGGGSSSSTYTVIANQAILQLHEVGDLDGYHRYLQVESGSSFDVLSSGMKKDFTILDGDGNELMEVNHGPVMGGSLFSYSMPSAPVMVYK